MLFKAARMQEERKEELALLMTAEMGKILKEAREDVQEAIDITYYAAGEGRRFLGETSPSEPDKFCMTVRRPIGVVGLITPWNFPLAISAWKILPALIAGNTVVFEPSAEHALLSIELVRILDQIGLPKGVSEPGAGRWKHSWQRNRSPRGSPQGCSRHILHRLSRDRQMDPWRICPGHEEGISGAGRKIPSL